MPSRPWYPFYPGDYLADTLDLDLTEHGIYRIMLDLYWIYGPLPTERKMLRRMIGDHRFRYENGRLNNTKMTKLDHVIDRFFTQKEQKLHNKRMDQEIAKVIEKSEKARKSAGKRWDANAMRPQCYPDPQPYISKRKSLDMDLKKESISRPAKLNGVEEVEQRVKKAEAQGAEILAKLKAERGL